jgi:hypothetical protein
MSQTRPTPSTQKVPRPRPNRKARRRPTSPQVVPRPRPRSTRKPPSNKSRRDILGGKRGDGNSRSARIRRPDPASIRVGKPDPTLTSVGGLVGFGTFLRALGVDSALSTAFEPLKSGKRVIYPMGLQMRLLLDLFVAGEFRIFGLESLARDPLFVHLAGGVLPSLDTVYRDVARFTDETLSELEVMATLHGLAELKKKRWHRLHLDIDTTVEPLDGESIEGALPGPNPRYHGRPSYHPVLARVAETDSIVGAKLRPGNTGFGNAEAGLIKTWIGRVRRAIGPRCLLYVRIDSAGDCTAIQTAIDETGSFFLVKAKIDAKLFAAIARCTAWKTVDRDAMGRPTRQVAELDFVRDEWAKAGKRWRVIAVRSSEREGGKQLWLWPELEMTVQVFITNDTVSDADDVAHQYDGRAGIEPLIAELKSHWGIGKVSSASFAGNHALLLLKVMAHNLLHRYAAATAVPRNWRAPWLRRALIQVPARLVRGAGRTWVLRLGSQPGAAQRE